MIAAFAAYALAWMRFPCRGLIVALVVGLLVVPLQMSLIPLLRLYNGIAGVFGVEAKSYLGVWLAHTAFGLPLAIYLLRNYMAGLPREIMESARIDGASHFEIFTEMVLPLCFPGARLVCHLPVPVDLERPAGGAGFPGRPGRPHGADGAAGQPARPVRQQLGAADGSGLRLHHRAADRLLLAAALFRPGAARRFGEVKGAWRVVATPPPVARRRENKAVSQLKIEGLYKRYGTVEILKDINLEIASGEFMVFVGPSGCGKSTLLRCIAGLEDISGGTLSIDGEVVNDRAPSRRGIAMVFQTYALYPHMSVHDNMAYALKVQKLPHDEVKKRVAAAADKLQLTPYLKRLPKQLSGGQRQRVAIGRAIVRDPKVFLFDEPLSNLDAALRVATRLEIAKLHHTMNNVTMVYVTHDQVEAMTLADRICVLRDGRIEQVGTPLELYERPQSLFVAGFIGSPQMNFLNGQFASKFNANTIGVRSEHIEIKDTGGIWSGEVVHSENLGSDSYIYVDVGSDMPLIVRQNGTTTNQLGDGSASPRCPTPSTASTRTASRCCAKGQNFGLSRGEKVDAWRRSDVTFGRSARYPRGGGEAHGGRSMRHRPLHRHPRT